MVHSILVLTVLLTPQEKALYADLPQIFSRAEARASDLLRAADVPDRPDGLFPGALWCLYEATGKDSWKRAARAHTECLDPVRQASGDPDSGLVAYRAYGNGLRLVEPLGRVVYSLDPAGAYDAPGLRELVRTFVFDRKAKTLGVTDRVCFDRPRSFETALVAHAPIDSLNAEVRSSGGTLLTHDETIPNPGRKDVYRRALAFSNPVFRGGISVVYRLD